MDRKVSIITPLYNAEQFIAQTIKSVQDQTYSNWEMLIVDDFSTDNGFFIAESFAKIDGRISIFKNTKNLGGAETRNVAIKKAQGDLIAFLDADDFWDKNKLFEQVGFMSKNNIGFSFTAYRTVDEGNFFINDVRVPNKVSLVDMYSHNYIGCLTAMYDVREYGKFYMPDIRKRQDYALWLLMLNKFDYAYAINKPLGSYRFRENSLSKNKVDAVKYYWSILRKNENLSLVSSVYYTSRYISITAMKRYFPTVYNSLLKF